MAQDPNQMNDDQPANDEQLANDDENEKKELTPIDVILATREKWERIKKSLDAVMPHMDTVIRLQAVGNKPKSLAKAKQKRDKCLADFKVKLTELPDTDPHVAKGLEIAEKLSTDLTQQQMGNFNFEIRRYTQSIVKIRAELMQKYKQMKKEQEANS